MKNNVNNEFENITDFPEKIAEERSISDNNEIVDDFTDNYNENKEFLGGNLENISTIPEHASDSNEIIDDYSQNEKKASEFVETNIVNHQETKIDSSTINQDIDSVRKNENDISDIESDKDQFSDEQDTDSVINQYDKKI